MSNAHQNASSKLLAVVTGGSSGIGFELAKQFATHGYDVILTATKADGLERAAAKIAASGGKVIDTIAADLTDSKEVDRLFVKIQSHGRSIDAIALNAASA